MKHANQVYHLHNLAHGQLLSQRRTCWVSCSNKLHDCSGNDAPHGVTHNEDGLSLMLGEQVLNGLHGKVSLPLLHQGVFCAVLSCAVRVQSCAPQCHHTSRCASKAESSSRKSAVYHASCTALPDCLDCWRAVSDARERTCMRFDA